MRTIQALVTAGLLGGALVISQNAFAQGTPPAEAKAVAAGPAAAKDAPTIEKPASDVTAISLGAGGLFSSGNANQLAVTTKGEFEMRRGDNAFRASLMGNYGESKANRDAASKANTENVQLRVGYDRYFSEKFSAFALGTARYDRFQGIAFRLNIDPGVKYIIVKEASTAFWAELGYDFQFDSRLESSRVNADGTAKVGSVSGTQLESSQMDHSARVFVGARHAFNDNVNFGTGLELLQSFVETDNSKQNTRVNFDAVLAAKLFEGFSVGVGATVRFDANPLPGKEKTDIIGNLSLIYSWSKKAEEPAKEPEAPKCPECPTPPPCLNAPAAPPPPPAITPAK